MDAIEQGGASEIIRFRDGWHTEFFAKLADNPDAGRLLELPVSKVRKMGKAAMLWILNPPALIESRKKREKHFERKHLGSLKKAARAVESRIPKQPQSFRDFAGFFNSPLARDLHEREMIRQEIAQKTEMAAKIFDARTAGTQENHYFLEGVVAYAKLRCGLDLTSEEIAAIASAAYAGLSRPRPEDLDPIPLARKLARFRESRPWLTGPDFQKRFAALVENLPD